MDKAQQESLIKKFDVDFDPKTNVEYRKGSKKSFYLEKIELQDDYEGSQEECISLKTDIDKLRTYNNNQMNQIDSLKETHTTEIKSLEEVIKGLKYTNKDLEAELIKVQKNCDSLKADNNENESLLKIADQEIKVLKSVRKIPLLGTDTLSYQSDILLRWQEHTKEWNDLVSDFQKKYLPPLKEGLNSFVTRVKNVEI